MYPRLVVDLKKLRSNLDACAKIVKEDGGCSLMIVTKGLCADPEMARRVADHPAVEYQNLRGRGQSQGKKDCSAETSDGV